MAKSTKKSEIQAPEHTTVEPVRGKQVRLTADDGWLVKSKNTGYTFKSVVTAHVAGWDVIEMGAAK